MLWKIIINVVIKNENKATGFKEPGYERFGIGVFASCMRQILLMRRPNKTVIFNNFVTVEDRSLSKFPRPLVSLLPERSCTQMRF